MKRRNSFVIKCSETRYDLDRRLGIMCYETSTDVSLESARRIGSDVFTVYEVAIYYGIASLSYEPRENSYEHYLSSDPGTPLYLYILNKKDLDTLTATRILKKKLKCSKITHLGLKDKAADTYQFILADKCLNFTPFIKKGSIEAVFVRLVPRRILFEREDLLIGNCFKISMKSLVKDPEALRGIIDDIKEIGFLPNYYSYQRFGVRRPITHLLGLQILSQSLDELIKTLICFPEHDCDIDLRCREIVKKKWMWIEGIICRELAKSKSDIKRVIKRLPREILKLYVSAFFSYIFNYYLSYRWILYGLGIENIDGEKRSITPLSRVEIPYMHITLDQEDLKILSGDKELILRIFSEHNLDTEDLTRAMNFIREVTGIKNFILNRFLITPLHKLQVKEDLEISFCIDKGGYATNLLREVFKENIYSLL